MTITKVPGYFTEKELGILKLYTVGMFERSNVATEFAESMDKIKREKAYAE